MKRDDVIGGFIAGVVYGFLPAAFAGFVMSSLGVALIVGGGAVLVGIAVGVMTKAFSQPDPYQRRGYRP